MGSTPLKSAQILENVSIVDIKVKNWGALLTIKFLICLASPQDTYEPRLTPQSVLYLLPPPPPKKKTHTHTQNKMCIHCDICKILGTPLAVLFMGTLC